MYGKLISENKIVIAQRDKANLFNYNIDEVKMRADGYKKVIKAEDCSGIKQPEKRYREENDEIIEYYIETYVEPILTYQQKRVAEYPPMAEFLDAQVKINSDNVTLIAEGQAQLAIYIASCLAVKEEFPKPEVIVE